MSGGFARVARLSRRLPCGLVQIETERQAGKGATANRFRPSVTGVCEHNRFPLLLLLLSGLCLYRCSRRLNLADMLGPTSADEVKNSRDLCVGQRARKARHPPM